MKSRALTIFGGVLVGTVLLGIAALACAPGTVLWIKQFGTPAYDNLWVVVGTHANGNFVGGGGTFGNLGGKNTGGQDAWVGKFGPGGARLWIRQFGTPQDEDTQGGATADADGNVIAAGVTRGALFGELEGDADSWLAKFDPAGKLLWGVQFAIPHDGITGNDFADSIVTDSALNIIVTGTWEPYSYGPMSGWVAKFNPQGTMLWRREFAVSGWDFAHGAAIDADDNIAVVGNTSGSLYGPYQGNEDAFLIKLSPTGKRLWARQVGSSGQEAAYDVAFDPSGNVFIAGWTDGALAGSNHGGPDAYVIEFSADGKRQLWAKQVGTAEDDRLTRGLQVDRRGNVILGGTTYGSLAGPNQGDRDGWVIKYGATGRQLWAYQFGTEALDELDGIAVDGKGNVFVSGPTYGSLGAPNKGDRDAWIARIAP